VAKITIRSKTSLAVIRIFGEVLALETIFYPDEIRPTQRLQVGAATPYTEKEFEMAVSPYQQPDRTLSGRNTTLMNVARICWS